MSDLSKIVFEDLQQKIGKLSGGINELDKLCRHHLTTVDAELPINPALNVLAGDQPVHYLDKQGQLVDALTVLSCWQRHLRVLAQQIHGSRLLMLEAHATHPQLIGQQRTDSKFMELDWIHRLAHEYLISAEAFIALAASAGLFNDGCVKRYPRTSDRCQISLHSFVKRDYIVRHAMEADLERLCQLEKLCWQHTRTSRKQIRARLQQYPQGQFILEKEGGVLGVIYSQRIASADALMTCNAENVHKLHQASGPVIQLLAVNIDPQAQNAGYGDQLLEFMLQRCSLITGIERVVGVTLCKNYNSAAGQSFEQYIQQSGNSQDPVLAFHQAHGAEVVKAIPGYRPQDHANMSNGVLVAYDILDRAPRGGRPASAENTAIAAETGVAKTSERQIRQFVVEETAQLLGVSSGEIDIDRPLMEMGLDSADLLKLGQQVEDKFGLKLGVGFFFEHGNIGKVIGYLATMLVAAPEAGCTNQMSQITVTQLPDQTASTTHGNRSGKDRAAATDIAIIGMACKLPGGIETPVQLWQTLAAKKCVIGSFPATRRHWPAHGDKPGMDQGGFVKDAEAFDAPFFRMSRTEAEITDPQQRILLELAWACLEDAGILPDALKGSNTGVFIGASNCDYSRLIQEAELEVEAHHGTGSSLAVLANRLSYFFDFSGPSLLIDTACSSSLVALHTAIQSLRSGECATALVGGVNFICHPDLSIAYYKAGMLAPDGSCKVFDAKADGYVRSEGAVVFLLKPLSAAIAGQDQIHAVIKGSAINHGGLAAGLTVPNPQKQSELLIAAWQDAGIAAHDLTYIEAHGTGTPLGDPIEIQGIQAAYMQLAEKQLARPCAIGSVKSNLGHLEPAAGITGLLKVVLSIQHRQLPASIHCDRLNPKIQLKDTPFFIQDQLREWNAEKPRLAAVSSFGSGGANAHVVVQEHIRDASQHSQEHDHLFVLSAASHDRLRIYAMRMIAWLEHESRAADFRDAIYTLQAGRTAMKQRLAIKVKDPVELSSKLRQWLAGSSDVADVWSGQGIQEDSNISRVWQTKSGQHLIDQALFERDLEQLGMLWASGIEIDWNKCYESTSAENKPRRVSLPTYPFARERYWIDSLASKQDASNGRSPAVLHPLLHSNTSILSEQRFTSEFSGNEFFLADHVIKGSRVLPGVCYLEMARAAVMASAAENGSNDGVTVRLKNVVWVSPVVVNGPQCVHVGVYADEQGEIEYEIYSNVPGEAAGESSEVIHGQGRACLSASDGDAGDGWLDWLSLRAGCGESFDAAHCYAAFSAMGIEYGPGHRGIRRLGIGQDATDKRYVLAEVELPGCVSQTQEQYMLHPSVLDSALQASMGFALVAPRSESAKPSLPFELEEIEILGRTPAHAYVYVRERIDKSQSDQPGTVKIQKFDIDICDEHGHVSVRLRGLTSRILERELRIGAQTSATEQNNESSLIATVQLVPRWDAVMPALGAQWPAEGSRVLVFGGAAELEQAIQARYPDVTKVDLGAHDFQDLVERIHTQGIIEHVMWLVPTSEATDVTDERLIQEQSKGVLGGLRLIKALLRLGYEAKNLGWTVVTRQSQAIRCDEHIRPSHASVHGLVGALAKEYPHWKIRLADLPSGEWPLDQLLGLPANAQGDALAYRAGEWHRQQLVPCKFPASQAMTYRHGGVYVVIGGAGGIGEVFSEHLIRNHQAQMIWIGRRELNADIQAKLDRLATLGPKPSYIRADATDRDALARAYQKIKAQHGRIHGLVHAAIALADKGLAQMDEDRFKASLAAKVDVGVRMAQVFAQEPMDCVLFFSSLLSFLKPAGQSNYLAGCTFEDAFAHQLAQAWSCPVKIMNWWYWGSRGIVASEAYRARMVQNGVGSIEPEEGMAALDQLLSAPVSQLALAKAQPRVLAAMAAVQDQITLAEKQLPLSGGLLSTSTNRVMVGPAAKNPGNAKDMQRLMGQLLFDQLRALGLFNEGEGSIAAWKEHNKFPALYDRWLEESLRVLTGEGYVTIANGRCTVSERSVPDGTVLWSEWDTRKGEWLKDPDLNAQVRMVDATLRALPEILTGKRLATEILFPKSSMKLVEGFYKGNAVADYFNAVLADAVVEFVELHRKHDPSAPIRIVEIGAGTGGTSEGLFKRLKPYAACIAEYCYTDISKAFLMHAEQAYGPSAPYLAYRLLNVEQALGPQGMELGAYDLAVATNVLHATKNIRKTLRNVKGLLKHNGVLLLNEILGQNLFTHLTFGLLEGWWLYEDTAVRIPGTPTLAPETWQRVLEGEGFQSVHFPAFASHAHGQQIIAAQSDGVIRQSKKEQQAVRANTQLFAGKEAAAPRAASQTGPSKQTTKVPAENFHVHRLRDKAIAALKKIVGQTIKLPVHEIDSKEEMEKYGIDSILIVSMVEALRSVFAHVTSTVFFEYRTIDALADHFIATEEEAVRRWVGTEEPIVLEAPASIDQDMRNLSSASIVKAAGRRRRNRPAAIADSELLHNGNGLAQTHAQDIAIIGLSGRYPEAVNIEAYWNNLREGKDCIVEVPRERWDWREYFSEDRSEDGRHFSKRGGFITGVDEFDPRFFNIAPSEAKYIDPQERLFLEHAWMAVEDAGYTRASLQATCEQEMAGQVGVYVGVMYSEYQLFSAGASAQDLKMGFAGNLASIANRVSYTLNLHGPSMTLDTMCSSSLTAIHVACQDLKQGRTSLAIAGAVNVSIHPNKYLMLSAGQFISAEGRCQSFGESGDGFIPAEGVGVVILKRLSEAERDGDHIYGVIRGSALNHGGKTNGYTVPSPQAQSSVISRALAEAHIDARHISYLEAHGTGTKLGDPIEIAALSKAFQHYTQDNGFCLIGSVKSNMGHCESAAGIAGLTKILLQMQHQQIVPSLHSAQLNPHIDFAKSPFVVNQELRAWEPPVIEGRKASRIAGISSFGAGGSNAHMIVEEYQVPAQQPTAFTTVVIPLSARTAGQLRQKAGELLDFVRPRLNRIDLASMGYTLQVGREAMEERLGLVVNSAGQLVQKLQAYVTGEQDIEDVYQGQVKGNKEFLSLFGHDGDLQQTVEKWIGSRKVSKLLELWVKGLEVDWSKLYGESKPRRMSLPGYPFARERYWIDTAAGGKAAANSPATAVLHPLVHSNTSDLSEQSYSSRFSGEEFFLKEHEVDGQRVLPGAAYLEMARAAVQRAAGSSQEAGLELRQVVWAQPVGVSREKQVSIALLAKASDEVDFEIYSQDGEQEFVHCQGHAVWNEQAEPARLDIEQLKREMGQGKLDPNRIYAACAGLGLVYGPSFQAITAIHVGNRQVLAQLRLAQTLENASGDYILHPSLMEGALQGAVSLMDGLPEGRGVRRVPLALERLRIVSGCKREMLAWVRYAPGSEAEEKAEKLDIDLCDERGHLCAEIRGISWQLLPLSMAEPVVGVEKAASAAAPETHKKITTAPPVRREIVLSASHAVMPAKVEQKKPKSIALAAPVALAAAATISPKGKVRQSAAGRAPVMLTAATLGETLPGNANGVPAVRLFDEGQGIFSIQVGAYANSQTPARDRMGHLLQALERVQQETLVKVVTISGLERCFPRGGREDYNQAVEQKLYQAIALFPCPVIAVLAGDAVGASLLGAGLCDLMVCNEDAVYGYTDAAKGFYPTAGEAELFSRRFGAAQAQDLLYLRTAATGKQLRAKGWTCPMVAGEQVEGQARNLAATLAGKSPEALRLLKQHLTRDLAGLVRELRQVEEAAATTEHPSAPLAEMASPAEHIHVDSPAENVVVVRFGGSNKRVEARELVAELGQVFNKIRQNGGCKAMVLASENTGFLPETEPGIAGDVLQDFQRLLLESEVPIVAALTGNGKGQAWLISQMCDGCVYSRDGIYSAGGMGQGPELGQEAVSIFIYRLGKAAGQEVLLTGAEYSGAELERRVGTLLAVEPEQVLAKAVEVAKFWAQLPQATLAAWKKRTAAALEEKIGSLRGVAGWEKEETEEKEEAAADLSGAPKQIVLRSKVVSATVHPEGIVVVKMEDREAKNMFSEALQEGVREVFTHIERTPGYKVVVLTGYDSYFSSGGTKESLLAIQAGKAKFTDIKMFQVALDCKLPVIAAMQGHGIGAGWSLGMLADVVLLSEESRYVSPYMNYGFTPGAGATWSLADKMGQDLARESLLTGEQYAGSELKARGLRLAVLPRTEVNAAAMAMARQMAQGSRPGLMGLKRRLVEHVREPLEETYRLELGMHEKTFVGRSETLVQIHENFYQETEASPTGAQQTRAATAIASPSVDSDALPAVTAQKVAAVDSDVLSEITASLKTLLAEELHLQESDIDEEVEFVDLGLDSISGVTWVRKINEKYHTSIEATKVYSYPTLSQLSRHVRKEAEKHGTLSSPSAAAMPPASAKSSASQPKTATKMATKPAGELISWRTRKTARFSSSPAFNPNHSPQPIAVIGMSGRFPQSKNLDEFWQNIAQGRNCVTQVPPDRWDMNRYYDPDPSRKDKTNSKWMGALDDIDCFDPLFFRISPQEAEYIDPQHRLFLQESYKAIEDAGYAGNISNKKCGVYLGISTYEYALLLSQSGVATTPMTSNSQAIAAARIAYYLNLKGPAIALDTACSSSLVAIHLACQGLLSGETDMALAGGVSAWLTPGTYVSLGKSGGLSSAGQCKAFDEAADGIVLSEGVGAIVLKRLKDAQADNDVIHAVILGSGINQDGRTNGMTAPSVLSQYELERSVYEKYKIDPGTITYVETHGAGSALGDPIELEALATAFKEKTAKKNYCALGSVKSNIGHPAAAAGVASVLKALLSLRHRTLAPVRNISKENSHFDFKNSPFYVCRERQAWDPAPGSLRRAAVSGFGFSGTNVHLVMEEYVPAAGQMAPLSVNTNFIVPISARTPEQLRQKAVDLLEFIRSRQAGSAAQEPTASAKPVDLAAMAYTLQVGREAMEERLGFVVNSVDQLAEKLNAYINGAKNIEDARQGRVDSESMALIGRDDDMQEAIDKWIARKKLAKLLDLWIKGLNFDWNKLYGDAKPPRISLPAYPFAKERCWIQGSNLNQTPDHKSEARANANVNVKSIEDIINQIGDGEIETEWAIQKLRLVSASAGPPAASLSYRSQPKPLQSGESNGHHRS